MLFDLCKTGWPWTTLNGQNDMQLPVTKGNLLGAQLAAHFSCSDLFVCAIMLHIVYVFNSCCIHESIYSCLAYLLQSASDHWKQLMTSSRWRQATWYTWRWAMTEAGSSSCIRRYAGSRTLYLTTTWMQHFNKQCNNKRMLKTDTRGVIIYRTNGDIGMKK